MKLFNHPLKLQCGLILLRSLKLIAVFTAVILFTFLISEAPPALPANINASSTQAAKVSDDPSEADAITLTVDSLSANVITTGQTLTITGTVTNHTQATLTDNQLVVQMQRSTDISSESLGAWLKGERDGYMSTGLISDLGTEVSPESTANFSITINTDSLPLTNTQQWGPRGLQIALTNNYDTLAKYRTVVVWDAQVSVDPTRITVVIPVVASASEMTLLATVAEKTDTAYSASALTETESQDLNNLFTRVNALLQLAQTGVVLAVDPALITTLENLSTADSSAPATATATATATPSASASATATSSSSAQITTASSELQKSLTKALTTGDVIALAWQDADANALAHLGQSDIFTSALSTTQDAVSTWTGANTTTMLASGSLDNTTLNALPANLTTVIAAKGDLPVNEELTYTPSGTATVNGRTVLIPDTILTDTIEGVTPDFSDADTDTDDATTTNYTPSALDVAQLLRSETAIITRQAPNMGRDLIVSLDREQASSTDPQVLAQRVDALLHSSWTQPQNLSTLVANAQAAATSEDQVERAQLTDTVELSGELSSTDLDNTKTVVSYLSAVTSIFTASPQLETTASQLLNAVSATSWRTDAQARASYIQAAQNRGTEISTYLRVAPSSTLNIIASEAQVPLRIQSSLNQEVTVYVHLQPSSVRLQADQDVAVTLAPHGESSITVPIKAVGSGNVNVVVQLLAKDGTTVGTPITLHTRVHANWESWGIRTATIFIICLFITGIVRTIKRGRRRTADLPSTSSAPPEI